MRIALAALAVGLVLRFLQPLAFVLLVFLGTGALAALLAPLVRRLPLPRRWSGSLVALAFLLLVLAVPALALWRAGDVLSSYTQEWQGLRGEIDARVASVAERLGFGGDVGLRQLGSQALGWLTGDGLALDLLTGLTGGIVGLALLAFGLLYFLAGDPGKLRDALVRVWPTWRRSIEGALSDLEQRLRGWAFGSAASMAIVGVLSGIGFGAIGLRLALPLAVLAGLAEIVPTLGPVVVFLLSLLVAATQGGDQVVGVAAIYVVIQTLESYVILPLVMRRATSVPPLVTLFTIVLWGRVFGLLGLFFAVPLNLVIWTVVERFVLERRARAEARSGPELNPP